VGVHATAVTASQSMPAAAGQLSVHTMASCYNCCTHSLPGPIVPFVLVKLSFSDYGSFAMTGLCLVQCPYNSRKCILSVLVSALIKKLKKVKVGYLL